MKKTFINFGKVIIFFLCWSIAIITLLTVWEYPQFVSNKDYLLRLYWETAPLIVTILMTIIFTKIVERKNTIKIPIFKNSIGTIIFGIVVGVLWIGMVLLVALGMDILHIEKITYPPNLFIWILAIFLNTIMQELLVRGYMFSLLTREYNLPVAIIITTIIFTFMHGVAFHAGILALINIVTASILLSLALVYKKGLCAPILIHFFWNSIGRLCGIVSLPNDYPIILKTTISGSNLISGGKSGIEGSIIVLTVNCVLIIGLLIYGRFQSRKLPKYVNMGNKYTP